MKKDENARDQKGRFVKGAVGRPVGAKNKRRTYTPAEFSASVTSEATVKLDALMESAFSVVEGQISEGNLKAAIWALDRVVPSERGNLSTAIPDADMSSLEGIIKTGQTASQMVAEGLLGLDEASRFMTILTNCGQLLGYPKIDELRMMIEEFEKQGTNGAITRAVPLPSWGRLSESSQ